MAFSLSDLEKIIAEKGDCRACLEQLDGEYIRQNLTMGGVADASWA